MRTRTIKRLKNLDCPFLPNKEGVCGKCSPGTCAAFVEVYHFMEREGHLKSCVDDEASRRLLSEQFTRLEGPLGSSGTAYLEAEGYCGRATPVSIDFLNENAYRKG